MEELEGMERDPSIPSVPSNVNSTVASMQLLYAMGSAMMVLFSNRRFTKLLCGSNPPDPLYIAAVHQLRESLAATLGPLSVAMSDSQAAHMLLVAGCDTLPPLSEFEPGFPDDDDEDDDDNRSKTETP